MALTGVCLPSLPMWFKVEICVSLLLVALSHRSGCGVCAWNTWGREKRAGAGRGNLKFWLQRSCNFKYLDWGQSIVCITSAYFISSQSNNPYLNNWCIPYSGTFKCRITCGTLQRNFASLNESQSFLPQICFKFHSKQNLEETFESSVGAFQNVLAKFTTITFSVDKHFVATHWS